MIDNDILRRLESVADTLVSARGQAFPIGFHQLAADIRAATQAAKSGHVYLHIFHGRTTPTENMEDWGFDGPVIGPLSYVHTTYGCELKFACDWDVARKFFAEEAERVSTLWPSTLSHPFEHHLIIQDGLLRYDGKFYGDWSVFGPNMVGPNGEAL